MQTILYKRILHEPSDENQGLGPPEDFQVLI